MKQVAIGSMSKQVRTKIEETNMNSPNIGKRMDPKKLVTVNPFEHLARKLGELCGFMF